MAEYPPSSIVAIGIILPLIALFAVILRFYLRLFIKPTYIGIDDWLILGAVILSMADGANLAVGAILGIQGRSYAQGQVPLQRSLVEAKSDYAQVILEKPLYGMMKLSVLFFYRRIFGVHKSFRVSNNVAIALITAWTISFFFADIFLCGAHPKVQWQSNSKDKSCPGETWLNLFFSITDAIGDFLVVSLPFPCIKTLQMQRRERIALGCVFLLGGLSTACSIVRLGFISKAFRETIIKKSSKYSEGTPPAVWSSVEAAVGILAACLPPLGPLIRRTPNPRILVSSSIVNRFRRKSSAKTNDSAGTFQESAKSSVAHLAPHRQNNQYVELDEVVP